MGVLHLLKLHKRRRTNKDVITYELDPEIANISISETPIVENGIGIVLPKLSDISFTTDIDNYTAFFDIFKDGTLYDTVELGEIEQTFDLTELGTYTYSLYAIIGSQTTRVVQLQGSTVLELPVIESFTLDQGATVALDYKSFSLPTFDDFTFSVKNNTLAVSQSIDYEIRLRIDIQETSDPLDWNSLGSTNYVYDQSNPWLTPNEIYTIRYRLKASNDLGTVYSDWLPDPRNGNGDFPFFAETPVVWEFRYSSSGTANPKILKISSPTFQINQENIDFRSNWDTLPNIHPARAMTDTSLNDFIESTFNENEFMFTIYDFSKSVITDFDVTYPTKLAMPAMKIYRDSVLLLETETDNQSTSTHTERYRVSTPLVTMPMDDDILQYGENVVLDLNTDTLQYNGIDSYADIGTLSTLSGTDYGSYIQSNIWSLSFWAKPTNGTVLSIVHNDNLKFITIDREGVEHLSDTGPEMIVNEWGMYQWDFYTLSVNAGKVTLYTTRTAPYGSLATFELNDMDLSGTDMGKIIIGGSNGTDPAPPDDFFLDGQSYKYTLYDQPFTRSDAMIKYREDRDAVLGPPTLFEFNVWELPEASTNSILIRQIENDTFQVTKDNLFFDNTLFWQDTDVKTIAEEITDGTTTTTIMRYGNIPFLSPILTVEGPPDIEASTFTITYERPTFVPGLFVNRNGIPVITTANGGSSNLPVPYPVEYATPGPIAVYEFFVHEIPKVNNGIDVYSISNDSFDITYDKFQFTNLVDSVAPDSNADPRTVITNGTTSNYVSFTDTISVGDPLWNVFDFTNSETNTFTITWRRPRLTPGVQVLRNGKPVAVTVRSDNNYSPEEFQQDIPINTFFSAHWEFYLKEYPPNTDISIRRILDASFEVNRSNIFVNPLLQNIDSDTPPEDSLTNEISIKTTNISGTELQIDDDMVQYGNNLKHNGPYVNFNRSDSYVLFSEMIPSGNDYGAILQSGTWSITFWTKPFRDYGGRIFSIRDGDTYFVVDDKDVYWNGSKIIDTVPSVNEWDFYALSVTNHVWTFYTTKTAPPGSLATFNLGTWDISTLNKDKMMLGGSAFGGIIPTHYWYDGYLANFTIRDVAITESDANTVFNAERYSDRVSVHNSEINIGEKLFDVFDYGEYPNPVGNFNLMFETPSHQPGLEIYRNGVFVRNIEPGPNDTTPDPFVKNIEKVTDGDLWEFYLEETPFDSTTGPAMSSIQAGRENLSLPDSWVTDEPQTPLEVVSDGTYTGFVTNPTISVGERLFSIVKEVGSVTEGSITVHWKSPDTTPKVAIYKNGSPVSVVERGTDATTPSPNPVPYPQYSNATRYDFIVSSITHTDATFLWTVSVKGSAPVSSQNTFLGPNWEYHDGSGAVMEDTLGDSNVRIKKPSVHGDLLWTYFDFDMGHPPIFDVVWSHPRNTPGIEVLRNGERIYYEEENRGGDYGTNYPVTYYLSYADAVVYDFIIAEEPSLDEILYLRELRSNSFAISDANMLFFPTTWITGPTSGLDAVDLLTDNGTVDNLRLDGLTVGDNLWRVFDFQKFTRFVFEILWVRPRHTPGLKILRNGIEVLTTENEELLFEPELFPKLYQVQDPDVYLIDFIVNQLPDDMQFGCTLTGVDFGEFVPTTGNLILDDGWLSTTTTSAFDVITDPDPSDNTGVAYLPSISVGTTLFTLGATNPEHTITVYWGRPKYTPGLDILLNNNLVMSTSNGGPDATPLPNPVVYKTVNELSGMDAHI